MPDRRIVEVPHFGPISMADGELFVADERPGGFDAHAVRIDKQGQGAWEVRSGAVDTIRGTFEPDPDELRRLAEWADTAWALCENPQPSRLSSPPPRWMWCLVVRRGNEARWLADRDAAPEQLQPMLQWLAARVDALAGKD